GDVDVFKYFLLLAGCLFAVGLIGSVGLKVIGEDELIDEAVDELEASGLLEESEFFRSRTQGYGTMGESLSDEELEEHLRERDGETEEERKKKWLLNAETSRFLKDRTMWFLAAGFLLVTGPGEAFIN